MRFFCPILPCFSGKIDRGDILRISLIPSVEFIKEEEIKEKVVIVIDVLRATSVITAAIGNGAKKILPTIEIGEAIELKKEFELLGGERKGLKIEGFDLSNSPLQYSTQRVRGKTIIMTTTNGTKAINKSIGAERIFIGSMLNGRAVGGRTAVLNKDIVLLCSGTYGKFSLDDFICAGKIVYEILSIKEFEMDDFAAAAYAAYRDNKGNLKSYVSMASHYKYLQSIGLEDDIDYCFTEDLFEVVPEYREGKISTWL